MVKISSSDAGGVGLISGWGAKIPHTLPLESKQTAEAIL